MVKMSEIILKITSRFIVSEQTQRYSKALCRKLYHFNVRVQNNELRDAEFIINIYAVSVWSFLCNRFKKNPKPYDSVSHPCHPIYALNKVIKES